MISPLMQQPTSFLEPAAQNKKKHDKREPGFLKEEFCFTEMLFFMQ